MARGFILHLAGVNNSFADQRRATSLPIRIGRNALNDCAVSHNFISDFHARIEDVDGRPCIRDLGSKNGIFVRPNEGAPPVRIAPQVPIDLASHQNEFFIGPLLRVRLETVETDGMSERSPQSSAASGTVLGNKKMLQEGLPGGGPIAIVGGPPPQPLPQDFGIPANRARTGPSPPGVGGLPDLLSVGALPPLGGPPSPVGMGMPGPGGMPAPRPDMNNPEPYRAQPQPPGGFGPPGASYSPGGYAEPHGPPAYGGAAPGQAPVGDLRRTGHFGMATELLAFQGLRELASSLVPGQPLETTGDVARLITKIHDTIEVFCRCFIPLREGYAQFVSSMDLQRAAMQRSVNRSRSYVAVEMANNPAAVASALLDWRDQSLDAPRAIEGIFADLMVHQVALLDGVMQGVRALLDELSPENIEKILDSREPRGGLGLNLTGRRHKAMWQVFCERYAELSDEKQAFSHIFGTEFTEAYREYRRGRNDGSSNT